MALVVGDFGGFLGGKGVCVCGGGGYDIVGGFVWFGMRDGWMELEGFDARTLLSCPL